MKIAANPAATSSEAGTNASSSRLRALMSPAHSISPRSSAVTRFSASSFERSLWSVNVLRRSGGTESIVAPDSAVAVELDPSGRSYGSPWKIAIVRSSRGSVPDEVDGARGHPAAGQDQEDDDEGDDEADWDAPTALAAGWEPVSGSGAVRRGGAASVLRRRLLGRLGLAAGADRRARRCGWPR